MEYKTKHYVFHCVNNKTAERDIEIIAKKQEKAYATITKTLNVKFEPVFDYYLVNSPEEVAGMTRYPYPVNGIACFSDNSVYAVYTEEIKCIGPHEDAHLISAAFGFSDSDFLAEGLAMRFDKRWWGIKNELWCKHFIEENTFISPLILLNNREFDKIDCSINYPIAGAFTSYLIKNLGIEKYKEIYTFKGISNINSESVIHKKLLPITNSFVDEIKKIRISDAEKVKLNQSK